MTSTSYVSSSASAALAAATTAAAAATAAATAAAGSTTNSVDDQQNKFLTLLVTQLQNQDPLNPTSNAELTSQLAQLSTVSGINTLNTTLTSLQSNFQSSQSVAATSVIGHGVLTAGSDITLASSKAIYGVQLGTAADDVQVAIKDSTGATVQTIDMGAQPAGTLPLAWDGTVDNLNSTGVAGVVADGSYTFSVTATANGTALTDATALQFGTVASVSTTSLGGVILNVPTVGKITMSDVMQVL